jgi:hypothetical protein
LFSQKSQTGLPEIGDARPVALTPIWPFVASPEFEVPVVQGSALEQLTRAPAAAEPRRDNAVEQFPNRPPLVDRYSPVEGRILLSQSRLALSRLHSAIRRW